MPRSAGNRFLVELVDWCRYVVDRRGIRRNRRHASLHLQARRGRLPDDELGLFRLGHARQPDDRPNQLWPIRAGQVAGGDHVSAVAGLASLLRARHCFHRFAFNSRLVRRGRPASGVARQRAAGGRATPYTVLSLGDEPREADDRPGRFVQGPADRGEGPAIAAGWAADGVGGNSPCWKKGFFARGYRKSPNSYLGKTSAK